MKIGAELAKTELTGESHERVARIKETGDVMRAKQAEKKADLALEKQKTLDTSKAIQYVQKELKDDMKAVAEAQQILNIPAAKKEAKDISEATLARFKQKRLQTIKDATALFPNADVDKLLGGEAAAPAASAAEFNYVPGKGLVPAK
jgi:hypothetical protein